MNVTPNGPQKPAGANLGGPQSTSRLRPVSDRSTEGTVASRGADGAPELSSRAQDFLRFRTQLDGLAPTSREDRIQALQAQIQSGTYPIDGARIADAMLRDPAVARALGFGAR